jgi:DNA invertase Pin-like site-specific DNA recombinase
LRDLTGVDGIAYTRVSTERQAGEKQTSLTDQRTAILAMAARLGVTIRQWFDDAGASGGDAEGREQFMAMLASCEFAKRPSGTPGLILTLNDSRFGRFDDPEEAAYWRIRFSKVGWLVRFVENDESENPMVRTVMRAIGSAQASEYRQAIKANAKRGARGTAEQGFWAREAPYGYRRKVVYPPGRERVLERGALKAPDEKVRLFPQEEEGAVVRAIFTRYASGEHTLGTLARWLAHEVPHRAWPRRCVQAILKNETYLGDVVGGMRPNDGVRGERYGKRDAHPALVSRELFAEVAARLAENRKRTSGTKGPYILSGLIECAQCHAPYVGGGIGGRVRPRPEIPDGVFWFYRCSSASNEPPYRRECRGRVGTIARHKIDGAVIATLAAELRKPSMTRMIRVEVDRVLAAQQGVTGEGLDRVRTEIGALERKRYRLVALIADETLTAGEAAPQLSAVRTELARLQQRETILRFEERRSVPDAALREQVLTLARDFPRVAAQLTGPALRELIRPWLAFATFDKETRQLTLGIRRLPAIGPFLPTNPPAPD